VGRLVCDGAQRWHREPGQRDAERSIWHRCRGAADDPAGHARYRLAPDALKGLYLCGSGAHPGGGITGGPGQNAAREILSELR